MKKKKKDGTVSTFADRAGKKKDGNETLLKKTGTDDIAVNDETAFKPGIPVMVKVDLETTFEKGLLMTVFISVFIAATMLLIAYNEPGARGVLIYFPIPAGLSALAIYCRRNTDNYYLIDALRKKIYFICTFFGREFVSLFARSEDILAFGASGEKRSGKHSSWIEYRLVAVDKYGFITALSDAQQSGRAKFNEKAEEYSKIMGCASFKCPNKSALLTRRTPEGSYEIYFEEIQCED